MVSAQIVHDALRCLTAYLVHCSCIVMCAFAAVWTGSASMRHNLVCETFRASDAPRQ